MGFDVMSFDDTHRMFLMFAFTKVRLPCRRVLLVSIAALRVLVAHLCALCMFRLRLNPPPLLPLPLPLSRGCQAGDVDMRNKKKLPKISLKPCLYKRR